MKEIPLSRPDIGPREVELVNQVLRTPFLSMGPMLPRFEDAVAGYVGTERAVAVSSGTSGLHLCMIAAGIGPGDEVITTPFSFVASANCVLYQGARPVFVDIDPQTMNISPDCIQQCITPHTKAILPVHVFGQPCAMDEIMAIAKRHGLMIIEDACEALGSEYKGQKVGTFGDAAVFAFYPNKQMTTGEGGVIATNKIEWASLFGSLRNQGRDESTKWLTHVRLGYNYRLSELSCALGVAQLERIEELIAKRNRVAEMYTAMLEEVVGIDVLFVSPSVTKMSWFLYVVRLAPGVDRDKLAQALHKDGIPTRPYFPPIHLQPLYVERFGYKAGDFPVTEAVARSSLALPFHGNMAMEEVEFVVSRLERCLRELAKEPSRIGQ